MIHHLRHTPWERPETRPAMANTDDLRPGLALTSRSLLRDGRPWIPVTGELHYSRVPRSRWRDALLLMRAGGVTLVSTYVFWIHHQERREREPVFDDGLDLAAFVRLARDTGLEVILRIGPWCHGEVRGGGLPDWVTAAGYAPRTDDPAYLEDVRAWFGHLGRQVGPLCGPDGPVIGIQLDNELYDQPGHLRTLKDVTRSCGLSAPLWTATAWGGADLPDGDVFPLYGGYGDGFWVDTGEGWDDSFRAHYFFSHQWDDPGIGRDLAGSPAAPAARQPGFPPATCELGGGMASAYHRRPLLSGADVAAVALAKLGSGSAWQGYYMYAGGANPRPGLQESQATGYPNDLPVLDYDFNAPIGAHLQTRDAFHLLRAQHAFLAAFGDRLATMNAVIAADPAPPALPDGSAPSGGSVPSGVRDRGSLRWAVRSDGRSGFVFVNAHQPYEPLPDHRDVRFDVELAEARVRFPHRPVTIPSGAFLWWPVNLDVAGVTIAWATLSPLTVLDVPGGDPVLVLAGTGGVPGCLAVPAGHRVSGHPVREHGGELVLEDLPASRSAVTVEAPSGERLRLLVLDEAEALRAWTPTVGGLRRLVLSDADIVEDGGTLLAVTAGGPTTVEVYPPLAVSGGYEGDARFERHEVGEPPEPVPVSIVRVGEASAPPVRPVTVPGRASAPDPETFLAHAAHYTITVPARTAGARSLLRVELVGDVAVASVGGRVQDLFWNGAPWDIDITPARNGEPVEVEVMIYPLGPGTPVWLPPEAEEIRRSLTGPAARIVSATVIDRRPVRLPS
ncbi:beta-galactosidase [Nonomuraea sp. NPDC047897]|uniref:beta-galactosidase n=1 Tax=Nonomuraea sp. NPDC047897 TaxID=3364346 RepID=UPI003710EB76